VLWAFFASHLSGLIRGNQRKFDRNWPKKYAIRDFENSGEIEPAHRQVGLALHPPGLRTDEEYPGLRSERMFRGFDGAD